MLKIERGLLILVWFSLSVSVAYRDALIEIYPFYLPVGLLFYVYVIRLFRMGKMPGLNSTLSLSSFLFLLSIVIALPFSSNPTVSLSYTVYLFVCFFLFHYMYQNAHIISERWLIACILIFSILQGVFGILQVITGTGIGVIVSYVGEVKDVTRGAIFGQRRAMGTFSNPNTYAQFMAVFSSFAVSLYMQRPKFRNLLYFVFCISCLVLAFSTGSWIAVFLILSAVILYQILKTRRYRALYKILLVVVILVLIAGSLFWIIGINPLAITFSRIERRGEWLDENVESRLVSLTEALRLSTQYFLGTGFEMFQEFAPEIGLLRLHNAFLLFLAEVGWIPTLLISWFGFLVVIKTIRLMKNKELTVIQQTAVIFIPSLIFFLMVYLTSVQRETLAVYFITYGYAMGSVRNSLPSTKDVEGRINEQDKPKVSRH